MSSLSPLRSCPLALLLVGCDAAQAPAPAPTPAPTTKRAAPVVAAPVVEAAASGDAWVAFASEKWDFTAEFPGAPVSEAMSLPSLVGPLEMDVFSSERDGRAYMLSVIDYPDTGKQVPAARVLDGARDGAVANIHGRLIGEKQLLHAGLPARRIEIVASPPEGEQRLLGLLVLRERRLYQVLVVAPAPASELPAAADRFFASVKIGGP